MNSNIEIFNETQKLIKHDEFLRATTEKAVAATKIYGEDYRSHRNPDNATKVRFQEALTLMPAFKFACERKRVAVLNFANPTTPGGGVLNGANAQEEYLCRATSLYNCLNSPAASDFYKLHRQIASRNNNGNMFLGTDQVIFSPDVPVLRVDKGYIPDDVCNPVQSLLRKDMWYHVDMITCAAPYFASKTFLIPDGDLERLFMRRIRNIFEVAINNHVQHIILGAFGCGAFNNPSMIVAGAFSKLLRQERYSKAFSEVVFAVKRTGRFCENIEAFQSAFSVFPPISPHPICPESNKRRFFE